MTTQLSGMSTAELLSLPVSVDLVTAGRALGIGRTTTYELARRDELPVPVLRLGGRYRVNRADLLRALGITDGEPSGPTRPPPRGPDVCCAPTDAPAQRTRVAGAAPVAPGDDIDVAADVGLRTADRPSAGDGERES